ncbi:MAG: glycosyltransferase family 4 protein [Anaerolineae bacterium]|nr:glycosyltransferase family 4 protein [Anaerolineae bacterium]
MRFVILTQYYLPETGAPQNRLSDLARRFKQMGHNVIVLTAMPNYPQGQIFPNYRWKLWLIDEIDGIKVIHCWLFASKSRFIPFRLISFFSFVITSALIGIVALPQTDALLVESPPLFLGITAWWLAKIKRAALIFNVSDLYPESAIALGYLSNRKLQNLFFRFEAWCYRVADLIVGQTSGIVENIQQRFPNYPVYLLTNGVDISKFAVNGQHKKSQPIPQMGKSFVVGYAGVLGYAQKLECLLQAAELLQDHQQIRFVLYGDGPLRESLLNWATEHKLANVEFKGNFPHHEILEQMCYWHLGVVPLANTPLMAGALPSKMFEVMASGLPVLLSAPTGEASQLVTKAQAGMTVLPENPQAMAEAILHLANRPDICQQWGVNGREYVMTHYDRAKIAEDFATSVQQIINMR